MKTTKWIIDPAHSEIQFKVKHMMITTVTGSFKEFSSEVETEGEDFSTARIRFEAATASIFTNAEQRDAHLRSADFFDADNFPVMSFVSSKLEKTDDDNWQLTGDLTIKDVTKPVKLDVEFGGVGKDPWG
ncbi:MAG: YceI family protein, partial [Bacteroidales bacterium]|nr:YceI family protein [Bacteroidales bacterium]